MKQPIRALSLALLIGVVAISTNSFAQTSTPATNAEVLQELQRMRTRIQELETQLKARDAAPAAASTAAPAVDAPTSAIVASNPGEDQSASEEPFAFADWTWLTGNPRNKTSPLETKYFTPDIRVDVNYTHQL